ncbi:MAG: diaminopimelate epimerase [Muribaculaceae bacterium]|nr:diaminopimelate epimerase [Muribaculaceae bacterium]MBR0023878.1 diaminopimelate epimerase [Muribaculaceae bacterium]
MTNKNNKIHFVKMHGLGNDYIYVDTEYNTIPDPSKASIAWSKPHSGIGSDGLILIGRSPEADFTMRIINADGLEGQMCGNASRCLGKFVYERGLTRKTTIKMLTRAGIKMLYLDVDDSDTVQSVTVDLMEPVLDDSTQFLTEGEQLPDGVFVSIGNPNYVIFVDDVDAIDLAKVGPGLEFHSRFPQRCNIEFAQVISSNEIKMRVWERGSGITMACGTGACATLVAAALTGCTGRDATIMMDGGSLHIEWRESDNHIYMRGPATTVFEGDIELPD